MNEYDSEVLSGILQDGGFVPTDSPDIADMIFLNTCSVRDHAEQKIHSRLGELYKFKKKRPDMLIGVVGCMAQNLKDKLLKSKPYVNLILGPDSYRHILDHINSADRHIIDTKLSKFEVYDQLYPAREKGINAWISIMRGCNKFCSYCIVPYTRGRERSRSVESIVEEAKRCIDSGFSEITLLGQNVNSYNYKEHRFPELLEALLTIKGLKRLRYTSPHPQDVDNHLIQLHADHSSVLAKHIHLPLQAGSDKVLRAMNRTYTKQHYLDLAAKIRKAVPGIGLSTDIIVGFPGESDADFRDTLDVMKKVKFGSAYTFKYSPRPYTKAYKMTDNVPEHIKSARLTELIELQKEHTLFRYRELIGQDVSIIVEGESRKNPEEYMGRTSCNKIVVFPKEKYRPGDIITRHITDARGITLFSR